MVRGSLVTVVNPTLSVNLGVNYIASCIMWGVEIFTIYYKCIENVNYDRHETQ